MDIPKNTTSQIYALIGRLNKSIDWCTNPEFIIASRIALLGALKMLFAAFLRLALLVCQVDKNSAVLDKYSKEINSEIEHFNIPLGPEP